MNRKLIENKQKMDRIRIENGQKMGQKMDREWIENKQKIDNK